MTGFINLPTRYIAGVSDRAAAAHLQAQAQAIHELAAIVNPPEISGEETAPFAADYTTYAALSYAAAGGLVDATATRVRTGCHTTPGDQGGAAYRWTSTLPAHSFYIADGSARGGYWELDEASPHLAQAGYFGSPLGADAATTEDAAIGLAALATYLSVRFGGGMIRLGWRNYYIDTNADLEPNVGLDGPVGLGHDPDAGAGSDTIETIHYQPALCIKSTRSVRFDTGFVARYVGFRRHGITIHTDLAGALTAQSQFSGTLLSKLGGGSARGIILQHCNFWGAAFGADLRKCPGARVYDCYGDCTTLLRFRDCGENIKVVDYKRKALLTGNQSTQARTLTTAGLFNSGGKLGVTVNESLSAEGLTTGQRIASDKAPTPYERVRRTVTVLSDTTFELADTVWDPAYATWSLTRMDWTFQPGLGSAIASFYNSGGNVGVRTAIDMPFVAGNQALLGVPDTSPAFGFWSVLTRVTPRDFVLNVAWDAGLTGYSLAVCELAAMPGNRRHASAVTEWGTTEGFAVSLDNCDGAFVQGTSKGNSGVWCNGSNCQITSSNEGGSIGELDLNDPGARGVVYARSRTAQHGGSWKSTGRAVTIDMDDDERMLLSGVEMVDNGFASLQLDGGGLTVLDGRLRGQGRIRIKALNSPLVVLSSEFQYEKLVADASISTGAFQGFVAYTHFEGPSAWKGTDARRWRRVHYQDRLDAIKSDATLQRVYDFDASVAAFSVPVTAPNLVVPTTLTATTSGTTSQALTTAGTAATGTDSGYNISTDKTARWLTITVVAQRTNGTGLSTDRESAAWEIKALLQRPNNSGNTALYRPGGAALTGIAPDVVPDADLANVRVDLSLVSGHRLVVDGNVATLPGGQTLNWVAKIAEVEAR